VDRVRQIRLACPIVVQLEIAANEIPNPWRDGFFHQILQLETLLLQSMIL
jgi:hypothetical protein